MMKDKEDFKFPLDGSYDLWCIAWEKAWHKGFETAWKELPLGGGLGRVSAASATEEIRKVSGRDHFLMWLRRRPVTGSGTCGRPSSASASTYRDVVYSFGDNLMGQLGMCNNDDKGTAPMMVLASVGGGEGLSPSSVASGSSGTVPGVSVARVLDIACGARHSLILVEEAS